MKLPPTLPALLLLLAFQNPLQAQPPAAAAAPAPSLTNAEAQLQSRQYAEAAASLSGVIKQQPENGYAEWLRAVALHADGKTADAVTACDAVPPDSKWGRKARLLKARALTDLKKFAEAEAIYAEEATRALSSARKDELAGRLAAFGDELARVPAPGEIDAPPPNPAAAAQLYRKALEVEFLTPDFTDTTLFKLAVTLQKIGQPEDALMVLNDYLVQFDKAWSPIGNNQSDPRSGGGARGDAGPAPEKPRDAKRFLQPGKHAPEARLRLTQCLMSRPDWSPARKTVEALLALQPAPDATTLTAAAWLRCQIIAGPAVYADQFKAGAGAGGALLPPPAGREQREQIQRSAFPPSDQAAHNEALRAFLTAYPSDSHAPETARLIGENLLTLGKTDEGMAALTAFIDGKNYQFDPASPANSTPDPVSGLSSAETLNRQKQEAFFEIAQVEYGRKKYEAAITQWRAYTVNYPNGAQWAEAQQRLIDAEFQLSIAAVAAGDEKLARERFDAFLTKYPLDERARQILFIHGQFAYAAAQVKELQDREKTAAGPLPAETMDIFRSAISQWSRLITKYPQSGEASLALYNTALILTDKLDRPEEGLAAFRRLTWGQWAALAKQRAGILEEKSLAISAPRVFRTDEVPHLALSIRNIKKVKVSRYALDLEAWLRSAHRLGGLEKLDVDLIAPEKTWEVEVVNYAAWRSLQQNIDIPFPGNTAGACVVRVEGDDWQSTTLVVRSDIELITEATRGELLVLALNARENKPAAGASVLVSDGAAIIATGKTGDDGVFRLTRDALPDSTRAFVLTPQGAMVSGLDLAGLTLTKQPEALTHTTFDRTKYFPGQTAKFLMLRRERKAAAIKPADGKITLRILAPDNRLVLAQPAAWAADGTMPGSFKIPAKAPEGDYKAQLLDSADKVLVSAVFPVAATPAENAPQLSLKLSATIVKPGGVLQATLLADWPWGLPLAGEDVEITFPDGRSERRKTDDAGVLRFDLKATSGTAAPWRWESVTLRLPRQSAAGEVSGNFQVTTTNGSLTVLQAPEVVPSGDTVTTKIRALNYDGTPAAGPVTATLFRLAAPPPSRVLEGVPWISYTPPPALEEKVESFALTSHETTGEAVCAFKADSGGHHILRFTTDDGKATTEMRFYVSGGTDPHSLRLFANAATVNEGGTATLRVQSLKPRQQVLVTTTADHFLSHQILSIPEGLTDLPIPVTAAHAPNFRVTAAAIDGRHLCAASVSFDVHQGLKVTLKRADESGKAPGVEVTDPAGKPVQASILSAMVRTSPDPDAEFSGSFQKATQREILSLLRSRDLRLAIHTSADLMFPGSSVKVQSATGATSGGSVAAANDQQRLIEVQGLEYGFNRSNTLLLGNNLNFSDLNCFVQSGAPGSIRRNGPLILASGVRRAADSFVQLPILPAIPDAAEARGEDIPDETGVTLPQGPKPVLFTNETSVNQAAGGRNEQALNAINSISDNAIDSLIRSAAGLSGNAETTGSSDSVGDSSSWNGDSFVEGNGPGLRPWNDGRWLGVVRVWTRESGIIEATLPTVQRNPLQAEVLSRSVLEPGDGRPGLGRSLMVVVNRDGLEGEASVGSGRGITNVKLDGQRLRQVFEVQGESGWNAMYTLSFKKGEQEWSAHAQGFTNERGSVTDWPRPLTAIAGGVLRAEDTVELDLPGLSGKPETFSLSQGRIFSTPAALLEDLADRDRRWNAPEATYSKASDLQARLTLMRRWRAGTPKQREQAEYRVAGCRDSVSELALEEQDGGWAWGGLDISADVLTTAQTWWALKEAKAAGITVSDKLQSRVEKYLTANYAGIPADDYDKKAAVLHAMAATGLAEYANAASLLRVRDSLSDSALAFLTAALVRMDRPEEARQLLAILETRAVRGKVGSTIETASWKGSSKIVRLSEPELITGMVLWSYARLSPDSVTGRAAANWLLNSRVMNPNVERLSLGPVTVALDAWFSGVNDWTEPGAAEVFSKSELLKPDAQSGQISLRVKKGITPFTIRPVGGKPVIFSIVLAGKPETVTDPKSWPHPEIVSRKYLHRSLSYGDQPLSATGTSPVKSAEIGQIVRVEVRLKSTSEEARHPQYLVWDEPLPSGFVLVPGSLEGNWDRVDFSPERIRLTYAPGVIETLKYELAAVVPGPCKARAAVISDPYSPEKYRLGPETDLVVMPLGVKSPDVYEMNQAEHFELAKLTFAGGNSAECLKHLDALAPSARKAEFEKDLARMRLWLLTDTPDGDAAQIVQAFETLNERHAGLVIPFDRILRVGRAYQKMGEHERGANVFSAALEANFLTDSGISAVLEDQGDYAGSVDFQEALWFDSPDSEDARGALFALSQSLFRNAPKAAELPVRRGWKKLEKNALLERSRDLLTRFITLHSADALADDAAFSLTNAFFALKDYAGVTAAAEAAVKRYPESTFLGQFQYMAALGHFWQFHYAEALAASASVANGDSKDRDLARYITGQIYHAEGKPAEAVDWYRKVKAKYPDAADALAAFEQKKIGVPEIATFAPGAEVKLSVTHRNVKEASLQIYKVDLMKLYLREKNLSRVTSVNLAGIAPEASVPVEVANAAAWADHQASVTLPLKEEGAYLVIARGDDLFTSGLVLITALKLDVREDAAAGGVRVNVLSAADGKYVADAEVKAIASQSTEIQSGQTDPRGIFEATGLRGTATVIVRQGENRFAFHRGTVALNPVTPAAGSFPVTPATPQSFGAPDRRGMVRPTEFDPPQIPQSFGGKVLSKDAYLQNLDFDNGQIQEGNLKNWDTKRRSSGKGVQADKAMKK
ncbi:MAG: tetratricopeptide repeat protein [Verrucomicrobiota bacterium]